MQEKKAMMREAERFSELMQQRERMRTPKWECCGTLGMFFRPISPKIWMSTRAILFGKGVQLVSDGCPTSVIWPLAPNAGGPKKSPVAPYFYGEDAIFGSYSKHPPDTSWTPIGH